MYSRTKINRPFQKSCQWLAFGLAFPLLACGGSVVEQNTDEPGEPGERQPEAPRDGLPQPLDPPSDGPFPFDPPPEFPQPVTPDPVDPDLDPNPIDDERKRRILSTLRNCGAIRGEGDVRMQYLTQCAADCVEAAPCEQLRRDACESPGRRFLQGDPCVKECFYVSSVFACPDGTTWFNEHRCDGLAECSDGSDEADCEPVVCPEGTLRPSARCNLIVECSDGSDEEGCATPVCD